MKFTSGAEQPAVGDKVIAYDPRIWAKRGRDFCNNEDCWKPARVVAIYVEPRSQWSPGGKMMYDLKFDHLGEVSRSHFRHAIRERVL